MQFHAKWIQPAEDMGHVCPIFKKTWKSKSRPIKAVLYLTALGVYEARLNDKRISEYVLAPGWTVYRKRLQYQQYDITKLLTAELNKENMLTVTVGKGWFRSPMPGWLESADKKRRKEQPCGIIGELHIKYEDGSEEIIVTDTSWDYGESAVKFSEIYDGETYDARFKTRVWNNAKELVWPVDILIPQEGEEIREMERIEAKSVFQTPSGETIVDFGQEITGYVEFTVDAGAGETVKILHGEVLDKKGNFYNANYRSAKAEINYICRDGVQKWHPMLTFFGFRYLKLESFPGVAGSELFTGIVVYSDIRKTGRIQCSDPELNQLFSNIFWGQKGNFLDVPTDCPQRDERLGWTGDAQVFVKAASYNFDVERFFRKWLRDLSADQRKDGSVGQVIPDYLPEGSPSAAWGDAAVICPWQIYQTYGNRRVLEEQFRSMVKWVDYITYVTKNRYLWTGGEHFGDWLGLDTPSGSYKGSSREEFIATAFYAYSTELLVKAGHVLNKDIKKYEELHKNIVETFRAVYPVYLTQTEHVLAVQFGLAENPKVTADVLAEMVEKDGWQMKTGFVGTPFILHVLSDYGHEDIAYTLLLRRVYPSWLYSVGKGATTIWEHWDSIMQDREFWSADMNSFNHYAYGAVADWVYEKAAGIRSLEEAPGFEKVRIEPKPDRRIGWLEASIDTRHGEITSRWTYKEDSVKYEITTPVPAVILIGGKEREVTPGSYTIWEN